jgi:hypothetical protein
MCNGVVVDLFLTIYFRLFLGCRFLSLLVVAFFTDSQIDAVDPFVDINQPPSTPSTEEGAGAASKGMHGGIAGIIVASVFLGIGALVGLTWFGKGCFFGLFGFFE